MKRYRINLEELDEYIEAKNYKDAQKKLLEQVNLFEQDGEGNDL